MASTIQIKRGTGSAVPSGLADGELAINLDNGRLYFGSGSTSVNDFSFGEITAEKYIVSSSVLYVTTSFSSGSTEFGNTADDTHTFTGHITASGNISADGVISASGTIIGGPIIGRDYVEFGNTSGNRITPISSIQYDFQIGNVSKINLYSTLVRTTTPFQVGVDSGDYLLVKGDITASGNISSSGEIEANTFKAAGNVDFNGDLDVDGTTNLDAVDIDGNVQLDGTLTVGVDDTGYDVTLFGDTANRKAVWDASADHLKLYDNTKLVLGTGAVEAAFDTSLYHDGTDFTFSNAIGKLNIQNSGGDTNIKNTGTNASINLILDASPAGATVNDGTVLISGSAEPGIRLDVRGEITASGNISSSGGIIANTLTVDGLSNQGSEATAVMIDGSNIVGTRELGSNAFTSTTIGTTTNALTVDNATLQLNSGTTFNGSAARTISIKDGGVDSDALANDLTLPVTDGNGVKIEGNSGTQLKIFSTHVATTRDVGLTLSASANGQQYSLALDRANDSFVIAPSDVGTAPENSIFELDVVGNITSSGNLVLPSGTITAANITTSTIRLQSNTDASVSSTGHAFQAGLTNSTNIIIDNNEIMARNNGAVSNLHVNPDGGNITFNNSVSGEQVIINSGHITASGAISSSAEIYTTRVFVDQSQALEISGDDATLFGGHGSNKILLGKGNQTPSIITNGSITASGAISSSGIINGKLGTTDTNVDASHYAVIQTAVNTVPFISNAFTINPSTNLVDMSNTQITTRRFSISSGTDGNYQGDVVFFGGTTSMTTGAIYHYKSNGSWELADATDNDKSDGLLGVALGAASDTNGVLLRGMVTLDHDPGAVGAPIYLTTTAGDASSTAPSGNGNIVRIIGYCLHATAGNIWFNPDSTFVEVNA